MDKFPVPSAWFSFNHMTILLKQPTHPPTHTHTHVRTRTHTHMHARTHTRTRAHIHMCVHTHVRAHTHTRTHACALWYTYPSSISSFKLKGVTLIPSSKYTVLSSCPSISSSTIFPEICSLSSSSLSSECFSLNLDSIVWYNNCH